MCNLYSITTNQEAIAALFRRMNRYVGNLPPMPGVFPDYPAPVIRNAGDAEDLRCFLDSRGQLSVKLKAPRIHDVCSFHALKGDGGASVEHCFDLLRAFKCRRPEANIRHDTRHTNTYHEG